MAISYGSVAAQISLRDWLPSDATSATISSWWDALTTATISQTSSAVTAWASRGGTSNLNLTGTTPRPTYVASAAYASGYPSVNFTATNQVLFANYSTGIPTGAAAGSYSVVGYSSQQSNYGTFIRYGPAATRQWRASTLGSSGTNISSSYYDNDAETTTRWTDNRRIVQQSIDTSGLITIHGDGTQLVSIQKSPVETPTSGQLSMNYDGFGFVGGIQEVIVWNGILSTSDRQKLEGYFAGRWGMRAALPAAHPFKSTSPQI